MGLVKNFAYSIRSRLIDGTFGRMVLEVVHRQPWIFDGKGTAHRRLHVGTGVQLNNAVINAASGDITIGDYSFLGHDVMLLTGTHDHSLTDREARQTATPTEGNDIVIGKGVWIASRAVVIGPCRIGDDVLVAAGAVVLPGEFPDGVTIVGVPGRVVGANG